jgi:hypothetical protein
MIAELPKLVALNLDLNYDATALSGLEIYSALTQDLGQRLTKLELRPQEKEKEAGGGGQALDPELVASFLRCTLNLTSLSLENIALGNRVTLCTATASLHRLTTLKLEAGAFPPLLPPSASWFAPIKHLDVWSCPGIDTPLLMQFISCFSTTLERLEVASPDLNEDQSAFYDLPRLKWLRLTAYQPFDHLISFKYSPFTHLILYPIYHFLATKARVPLAQSLSHFETTLEVVEYDEDLVDSLTIRDVMDVTVMLMKIQRRLQKRAKRIDEGRPKEDDQWDTEDEEEEQSKKGLEMFEELRDRY